MMPRAARSWATSGLQRAVYRMEAAFRAGDGVGYWDAVTSGNDWRAALSIACGHDPAGLNPLGGQHCLHPDRCGLCRSRLAVGQLGLFEVAA